VATALLLLLSSASEIALTSHVTSVSAIKAACCSVGKQKSGVHCAVSTNDDGALQSARTVSIVQVMERRDLVLSVPTTSSGDFRVTMC
jgi:hypothetical protein